MTAGYDTYRNQKSSHGGTTALSVAQLFDVIATAAREAKNFIEKGDIEGRFGATDRASAIISGLERSLQGTTPEEKDMVETLQDFYRVLRAVIWQIDSKNDLKSCDSLERTALQMAEGWRDVDAKVIQQMVAENPGPEMIQGVEGVSLDQTEPSMCSKVVSNLVI